MQRKRKQKWIPLSAAAAAAISLGSDALAADSNNGRFHDPNPRSTASPADIETAAAMGNIYGLGANSRKKASRVNDSVTILVNDSTSGALGSSMDLSRDSANRMSVNPFPNSNGILGRTLLNPDFTVSRGHSSDSTAERTGRLVGKVTGRVIDVRPNGHLVIEARKATTVNGETQFLIAHGVVDPKHLSASSEVNSDYVMDAHFRYEGRGPLTRMDKRGVAAKFIDFVNPW